MTRDRHDAEERTIVDDDRTVEEGEGGVAPVTSAAAGSSPTLSEDPGTDGGAAPPRRGLPTRRRAAGGDEGPRRPRPPDAVDPEALALAHRVVDLASDKKASDIVLLDVRGQTTMTDYFVICSGASERQLAAIAEAITSGVKEQGSLPLGREGQAGSHWLLLDLGSVIVHVMSAPEREYYQLEKLWADAALLLHLQ
jgi:ribosome-associated protein